VVALSGGPDSVALADALTTAGREMGFSVVLAHLDHQLRPESADDARFCVALGERLGVPVRVGTADVKARAARDHAGLEDAARSERYEFLDTVREAVGARFIAVGHTADDQAETFLLRLLRGAGADGLGAMRPRRGAILRPLLTLTRKDVLDHLAARGLACCYDATNHDVQLMRNRVRHELLPYLESRFNPEIRRTLVRSAELLAEDAAALEARIDEHVASHLRRDGAACVLPLSVLRGASPSEARRMLRRLIDEVGGLRGITAQHVDAVRALVDKPDASGHRICLPGRRNALVSFDHLRIEPAAVAAVYAFPLSIPGRVELPGGLAVSARPDDGPPRAEGDTAVIAAPAEALIVRTRRPGDRVVTGAREMSLKRFLMQQRVPSTERGAMPLVAAGDQVLWVPGKSLPTRSADGGRCVRLSLERTA
jgi:tRNA(Ile)-lysidine synthase